MVERISNKGFLTHKIRKDNKGKDISRRRVHAERQGILREISFLGKAGLKISIFRQPLLSWILYLIFEGAENTSHFSNNAFFFMCFRFYTAGKRIHTSGPDQCSLPFRNRIREMD